MSSRKLFIDGKNYDYDSIYDLSEILQHHRISIGENVDIGNFVSLSNNITIGNNVKISKKVKISHNVEICDNAVIGLFSIIENYVKIGKKTKIGNFTNIEQRAIIGKNVFIDNKTIIPVFVKILDGAIIKKGMYFYSDTLYKFPVFGYLDMICLHDKTLSISEWDSVIETEKHKNFVLNSIGCFERISEQKLLAYETVKYFLTNITK